MPTFTFSTLTPGEVWRAAWDDSSQTLKTALYAQIVGVQQEVKIDAADDSVVVFQPTGASLHVFVDNFDSLTATGITAFQGTNPWIIGGTVTVSNFPSPLGVTFGSAGTITQGTIIVGTAPVRLTVSGSAPSASRTALIGAPDPNATANFYVGSNTVGYSGTTRGIPIVAGERFIANNDSGDYYIVSDGVTQTVFVLEKG